MQYSSLIGNLGEFFNSAIKLVSQTPEDNTSPAEDGAPKGNSLREKPNPEIKCEKEVGWVVLEKPSLEVSLLKQSEDLPMMVLREGRINNSVIISDYIERIPTPEEEQVAEKAKKNLTGCFDSGISDINGTQ